MTIPLAPTAPVPGSAQFALQAKDFTDWMHDVVPYFNDAVDEANRAVTDAEAASGSADDAVLAAQQARNAAQGFATNAANSASAAGTAKTVAETAKAGAEDARDAAHVFANAAGEATGLPAPLESMPLGSLRVKADGSGLEATYEAPAGDVKHIEITASAALAAAQKGALIDVSGTGITLTLDAAALGNGWWCYLRIVGSTAVTASAAAGQAIDGVASGVIKPGMTLLVQCDGANFNCVRVGPRCVIEVLTSGTSWVTPLGVRVLKASAEGGGGGGALASASTFGGGGGGGGVCVGINTRPGDVFSIAIGAGGNAGASGGTTSLSSVGFSLTAPGGGGATGNAGAAGGAKGSGGVGVYGSDGAHSTGGEALGRGGVGAFGISRGGNANQPGTSGGIILEY